MRYRIKERIFCLGDDYRIQTESGDDVMQVDGRWLSFGDKLSLLDMKGNKLAFIDQRLLSWGPTYEIHRGDGPPTVIKKKLFTLLRCRFEVDVPGPDDLEATGSFLDHEYHFTRGGNVVASVSKKWFSWSDSYCVDVARGQDDVLLLACAIVIDLVCHADEKEH